MPSCCTEHSLCVLCVAHTHQKKKSCLFFSLAGDRQRQAEEDEKRKKKRRKGKKGRARLKTEKKKSKDVVNYCAMTTAKTKEIGNKKRGFYQRSIN